MIDIPAFGVASMMGLPALFNGYDLTVVVLLELSSKSEPTRGSPPSGGGFECAWLYWEACRDVSFDLTGVLMLNDIF